MRYSGILGSSAALAAMIAARSDLRAFAAPSRQGSGVTNWRKAGSFDPRINRHTGKPHQHQREIARRLRQQARRTGA